MANPDHLKILVEGVAKWNEWRAENTNIIPDLSEANLHYECLIGANLSQAVLNHADLVGADFSCADLGSADLSNAYLHDARFVEADLTAAKLVEADLSGARFVEADLSYTIFFNTYLHGARFIRADLNHARFIRADLNLAKFIRADLTGADLRYANLVKTFFKEATITGANLYGTGRDSWRIHGIKCDYIFFDSEGKARTPKDRNFAPGEFEALYKQLPKIEYFFEHGFTPLDAFLMDQAVRAINARHPEFELKLDSFHSRGLHPHAVFTVIHKDYAAEASDQIKADYETRIKILEAERDRLEKCFNKAIEQPRIAIRRLEMGDRYQIEGQAGAVGPGAHAHDINFTQLWHQVSSQIDLARLADELASLRAALKKEAVALEHDSAVGEIASAEAAAREGKGAQALEHLKRAGNWAFGVAEKIGVNIASAALKTTLDL